MTRRLDPDQKRLYLAEEMTFIDTLHADPLHSSEFMEIAERLFTHDWWERHGIPVPIIEPTTAKDTSSYAWLHNGRPEKDPVIRIAPCDINPWILTHEAAHVAQYHLHPMGIYGNIEAHGREFRATYLTVAELVLGQEAARRLAGNFSAFIPERTVRYPVPSAGVPALNPEHDPDGLGLFPAWRRERSLAEARRLHPAGSGLRINGAIAL